MDVPWAWVPVAEDPKNPLVEEFARLEPRIVPGASIWKRSTFAVGPVWQRERCDLAFATAYFVPVHGIPVVANFFDSNIYEHFGTWVKTGRLLNALLIRALSDFAIFRAKKLFVLSQYCAGYLARHFKGAAGKIVAAAPGCSPPKPKPEGHRPDWARDLTEPFLLYVGTFSENKNQRRLIEAYGLLQKEGRPLPPLLILGPCDPDYHEAALAPALKSCPRPDRILLPGRVSEDDLIWAYHEALAYVQPSIAEGFGMPVIEAMSYGLPVACSNTTSLPETAGGAALLFDPVSLRSLGEALLRLAGDETLRRELRHKAATRWKAFTWEANARVVSQQIAATLGLPA
ncbi:MAG: glycosyltransferase family 1 protein [Chthoniobacteraceae bacterium]|nr:glycosyltransferase family 1 protein [Chthoniobacteraceae bacterium]